MPPLVRPPIARSRLIPSLFALAATLALGLTGPALPGLWHWLHAERLLPLLGPVLAASAGLVAYALARSAAGRAGYPLSLCIALVVASLPGMGVPALLVPLALAMLVALDEPKRGLAALASQCAAGLPLAAAALDNAMLGGLGALAMLAAAAWMVRRPVPAAANDNPPASHFEEFSWLPAEPGHARVALGIRPSSDGN